MNFESSLVFLIICSVINLCLVNFFKLWVLIWGVVFYKVGSSALVCSEQYELQVADSISLFNRKILRGWKNILEKHLVLHFLELGRPMIEETLLLNLNGSKC